MGKWILKLLVGTIASFYYFPFVFSFFPALITKNAVAVLGLVFVLILLIQKREFTFTKELLILLILSSFVSIVALFSITYNQTPDVTYVSYIRSACIWLSGAFAVSYLIYLVHGKINLQLVINYLIGVCIFQCTAALLIEFVPAVASIVDSAVIQGQGLLKDMGRLYGVGASLDVAGSRFSAVLVGTAFAIERNKEEREGLPRFYLVLAFVYVTVVGNMIARTTIVGSALGLAYIGYTEFMRWFENRTQNVQKERKKGSFWTWVLVLAIIIPIGTVLYRTSTEFYDLMRFGFEGFFSLVEKGTWDVSSNETLKQMVVWPEELRTWVIGDGYFMNQANDANYIGEATNVGFYMNTDIGYLRFIFYFGVIGLIAISSVMVYSCIIACKVFKDYTFMILLSLLAGFIIWLKVSTDLFPFYALLASTAMLKMEVLAAEPELT